MDLNQLATEDSIDAVSWDDIYQWATAYLPAPSTAAFATWINVHIGDWEDGEATISQILTGAYLEWIGDDLPTP